MPGGEQPSASLGDALHVTLQQRRLLYGRRVGAADPHAPNAVLVPHEIEVLSTFPIEYVTGLQAMEEMENTFSTLTAPALQAAFQVYVWPGSRGGRP
jgi:hypothetical protein